MWYGSGTIQVAENGTTATGTGTQFIGNVRVGDGIAIQGSASLHEVTGVTSNTQLTFSPPYAGTAGSGKAFRIVPVLGYDKDLSDAFNALRLQFGDQLSNLQPWATAPTQDAAQTALGMSTSGKAVATGTPAQGRTALWLGTAATRNVGTATGDVMQVGAGGWLATGAGNTMGLGYPQTFDENVSQIYRRTDVDNGVLQDSSTIHFGVASNTWGRLRIAHQDQRAWVQGGVVSEGAGGTGWTAELYHTGNTTVDSNGFIKEASPIIKLHSDRVETEADGAFERLGTGHYRLTGCNGLRLDDGWYIETPHDRNGNKYFNIEWEQDIEPNAEAGVLEEPADVTLTIRCYERVWNPQTGQYDNGDPVDIPDGRWIDLRMNEVRQPEPEMPEAPDEPELPTEPTEPVIPSVVTMALADLPEPQKTAALIEWNHRQTLEREHPLVAQVATALGLTEQQLDELFVDAAGR